MPPVETRRLALHAGGVAAYLYVSRLALMVRGVVAARFLGPAGFGLWNALQLVWEYGQYCHLGVLNGLSKDLPFRLGRGEEEEVGRLQDVGLGSMLLTSIGGWILLVAGVLLFHRGERSALLIGGVAVAGAVVVIEEILLVHVTVLRARGRIHLISRTEILYALVNLGASVALLLRWGLAGLLAAWIVTRLGALVYLAAQSRIVMRPRWDAGRALHLLRRGGWIFLYLVMAAVLRTLDRVVVLSGLGVESLGYYALASTVAGLVANLPAAMTFVLYPRFLERYGEAGDPGALAGLLRRSTLALGALVPVVLAVIWFLLPAALFYVLPEYVGAVPAIRLLMLGSLVGSLGQVAVFFLLAVDRDPLLVLMSAAGAALGFGLCILATHEGRGIEGVAGAKAVADTVYGGAIVVYAGAVAGKSVRRGIRLCGEGLLPALIVAASCVVVGVAGGWPSWRPGGAEVAASVLRLAAVCAISAPFLWVFLQRTGLRGVWRELRGARAELPASGDR